MSDVLKIHVIACQGGGCEEMTEPFCTPAEAEQAARLMGFRFVQHSHKGNIWLCPLCQERIPQFPYETGGC